MTAIIQIASGAELYRYTLTKISTTIGRARDNDVVCKDKSVSNYHARVQWRGSILYVYDLGSTNGTQINGKRIKPEMQFPLADGDRVIIGNSTLTFNIDPKVIIPEDSVLDRPKTEVLELKGRNVLTIGRDTGSDVVLAHPTVSRKHARIAWSSRDGGFLIEDLGSTNGTFVNSKRVIKSQLLQANDIIYIGPYRHIYRPETIEQIDESNYLRLDAFNLKKLVSKRKNLLKDISLSIKPCTFAAIVGASGAGKSTLLDALNGFRPASDGSVLVNGTNLYANYDAYRTQLGYVPQNNIVHMELTPYEALDYSARLRLPSDTTATERYQRVTEVLSTLGLTECKGRPIRDLSGGEQKRVSMGVELLTKPALLFLDEATSGLDPGTERQMMKMMDQLAVNGQTVILVTHATKNVMLCDSVAFLNRGGYLAYYGPPREALKYFNVADFDDIYDKLQDEKDGESWSQQYLQYRKKKALQVENDGESPALTPVISSSKKTPASPAVALKRVSAIGQFTILSRRNINILVRDKASIILMALIAPIVGSLDFFFWTSRLFDNLHGDATRAITNLFMAAIICSMIGALVSMRDIVREIDIYRRERMVVLKIIPYVLSKVWIATLVSVYSAGVLIVFIRLAGDWPPVEAVLPVYITLALGLLAGMMMGLFISAISPNQNVTPLLLLLVLIPQILFGGIMPACHLPPVAEPISHAITTKWTFESLVTISGMGKDVAEDSCWQMDREERSKLTITKKNNQCNCMGDNIFKRCDFPGILQFYHPSVDEKEPLQPVKPGDPPPEPDDPPVQPEYPRESDPFGSEIAEWEDDMNVWENDMDTWKGEMDRYQEDMKGYEKAVNDYQKDIEVWESDYRNWETNRSRAIGEAEGTLKRMYDDYGHAFAVNVSRHWLILLLISCILLGFVLITMRLKDRIC